MKEKRRLVKVKLFRDSTNYREDVFVSVNGESWQIQRGVEVEVPWYVGEVLENSARQDQYTASLIEKLENAYLDAKDHL